MKKTIHVNRGRPIAEMAPLQVTMTPQAGVAPAPGQPPHGTTTMSVNAQTPEQAIQQAVQKMPGQKLAQIAVGPVGAQPTPVPGTPQAPAPVGAAPVPPTGAPQAPTGNLRPNVMPEAIQVESYSYPYGIVVPKVFEEVLRKATQANRRTISGIQFGEVRGRVHIQVENAGAMAALVSRLGKSREARARTILEGIRNSR